MDNLVYHYTSIDAFRHLMESIPKSKYRDSFLFRASNILYMNDPSEFIYGRKIFIRVLEDIEESLGILGNSRLSIKWSASSPEDEHKKDKEYIMYLQRMKQLPFVLSYTRLRDSLPMWLNYGNNGRGVCLAFQDNRNMPLKSRKVENGINVFESFYTSDVYYDKIEKDSSLYKLLYNTMSDYKDDDMDMGDSYFDALIQYAAPFIKTKHYMSENEVRLSQTIGFDRLGENDVLEFRCNSIGNLIPYINVEINVDQLRYVILGPQVDYNLTKIAIDMMSERYWGKLIDIVPSAIQYRDY